MAKKIVTSADLNCKVTLIGNNGEKFGLIDVREAEKRAMAANMDLVLVSQNDSEYVCRIMDANKDKFKSQKKQKCVNRTKTKEVKFGPAINPHDIETKVNHINAFLEKGHHVKITLLKNRRNPERAESIEHRLGNVLSKIEQPYSKESDIKSTDNFCFVCLSPSKKKI